MKAQGQDVRVHPAAGFRTKEAARVALDIKGGGPEDALITGCQSSLRPVSDAIDNYLKAWPGGQFLTR